MASEKSAYRPSASPARSAKGAARATGSYASEGVKDNDPSRMPASDWQILALLTVLAAVVRLFRIAQPTSVVFDEVQ